MQPAAGQVETRVECVDGDGVAIFSEIRGNVVANGTSYGIGLYRMHAPRKSTFI